MTSTAVASPPRWLVYALATSNALLLTKVLWQPVRRVMCRLHAKYFKKFVPLSDDLLGRLVRGLRSAMLRRLRWLL
jgi:hypothetical protein